MSSDDEFVAGYLDGRDPDAPKPSDNRSHSYRHSFAVGRAEIAKGSFRPPFGSYEETLRHADLAAAMDEVSHVR